MGCGRTGPSLTTCDPRRTTIVTGLPFEPEMRVEMSGGVTGAPLTRRIVSPGRKPIVAAGRLGKTSPTVVVALPPPTRNRQEKSTTARIRLVAGPARITTTRLHVRWRQ